MSGVHEWAEICMAGLQVQAYIAYAHFVLLVVAAAAFCCCCCCCWRWWRCCCCLLVLKCCVLVCVVAKVVVVVVLIAVEMLFFMVALFVVHCSWLLLTRFLISSLEYLFTCLLFPMLFRVQFLLLDSRRALEYRVIHLHGSLYAQGFPISKTILKYPQYPHWVYIYKCIATLREARQPKM